MWQQLYLFIYFESFHNFSSVKVMRVTVFKVNFPHKKFQSNMKDECFISADDYFKLAQIRYLRNMPRMHSIRAETIWVKDVDGEVHGIVL